MRGLSVNRRAFLKATAGAWPATRVAFGAKRKKLAALSTIYFVRSHSDNFITRFLEGYWINDRYYPPPCDVVSLYVDQVPPFDISRKLAQTYGFRLCSSISEALTLDTGKLAVDGVLQIAEHGDYPDNDKLQKLYPDRKSVV